MKLKFLHYNQPVIEIYGGRQPMMETCPLVIIITIHAILTKSKGVDLHSVGA